LKKSTCWGGILISDLRHGFYLGDLLVEPMKGQISDQTGSVNLPPKPMEVLLCLAEGRGELLTQDELIERVWGAGRGSPDALSHAVSEIRGSLEDKPDKQQYIQHLPKRGYRLIVTPVPISERLAPAVSNTDLDSTSGDVGLFDKLKHRGLIHTAIAYGVFGWLVIQLVDVLFDQLYLPAWAGTFITVLVIMGFPIAIVLSWFLEFRDGKAVRDQVSPADANWRRFSRTYLSVIAGLAIAAVIVFIYDQNIGLPQAPDLPTSAAADETGLPPVLENSIAVLPFSNLDGGSDTQVFVHGLVDDVITRLSRVPGLLVSSRGDSYTLEPNSSSDRVRERLRVALYVEGSVEMQGERMRIIVQLVDSATGFYVLSRSFDRQLEDFFDIRDEITELTVANVRVALPPDTQAASIISRNDPSLDVYVLYRRGVESSREPKSIKTLEAALSWFDQALEIDPDYAAAHAGKCSVYVVGYPITDDPEYIDNAEDSCAQALNLNPNLDIVHTALGELYRATGRYPEAEAAYLEALKIDPNSVASLFGLGRVHMLQKRSDEAEARFNQAIGLHPGDWSAYNALGYFLYKSGRYAEAAVQYEVVVALDGKNMVGFTNLGTAYMLAGDFLAAAIRAVGSAP
jgi:TolB-like protein/DNA-binding winged helix-turn-helix (wHTH) protein/Tfp pilus assembly protein PilF